MSTRLLNLFLDARPILKGSIYEVAGLLLKDPAAQLVSEDPSVEEVDQLLPTLRARAVNAHRSGARIFGLTSLIKQLESMPAKTQIVGYGVVSPRAAGNVYFLATGLKPVGTTIVQLTDSAELQSF